jgi:hypothetical protein
MAVLDDLDEKTANRLVAALREAVGNKRYGVVVSLIAGDGVCNIGNGIMEKLCGGQNFSDALLLAADAENSAKAEVVVDPDIASVRTWTNLPNGDIANEVETTAGAPRDPKNEN